MSEIDQVQRPFLSFFSIPRDILLLIGASYRPP